MNDNEADYYFNVSIRGETKAHVRKHGKESWMLRCNGCGRWTEFDHPNLPNAHAMAREAGWIVDKIILCPKCAGRWPYPTDSVHGAENSTR